MKRASLSVLESEGKAMIYYLTWLGFHFWYMIIYMLPVAVVLIVLRDRFTFLHVPFGILALALYLISIVRAHHAAGAAVNEDLGFVDAHNSSGARLRFQLSVIPIIGRWFYRE